MNDREIEEKIDKLDDKADNLTSEFKKFEKAVHDVEEVDKDNKEEESSNASVYLRDREYSKKHMEWNHEENNSDILIRLEDCVSHDVATINTFLSDIKDPANDIFFDEASALKDKLVEHQKEVSTFREEVYAAEASKPDKDVSDEPPYGRKSLLDDYANPSLEPSDYTGGDD